MNDECDSVEQAMQALKARSRGRAMSDLKMEDRLMQEFSRVRGQRRRRRTVAVAAIAALAVSSAGFAAAGGVDMVKSWFVELELVDTTGKNPPATYELQGSELIDANGHAVGEVTLSFDNEEEAATGAEGKQ
jgi:hypothetical protein